MQIMMIASRTRQGGRMDSALLSAGSTWHARQDGLSVLGMEGTSAAAAGFISPRYGAEWALSGAGAVDDLADLALAEAELGG